MGKLMSLAKPAKSERPTRTIAELLLHYAGRDPKTFLQYDAHDLSEGGEDDVMQAEADGFCVTSGERDELMQGSAVRVLVDPETPLKRAVLGLRKIANWIEEDMKRARARPGMTVGHLMAKENARRYQRWTAEAEQAKAELAERGMKLPEIPEPPPAPPLPPSFAAWLDGWNDPVLKAAGEMIRGRLAEIELEKKWGPDGF